MATTRKIDGKRRLVMPDNFSPGDTFLEEQVSATQVTYTLIEADRVPQASVIQEQGSNWPVIAAPLESEAIARAVRQDRDER